MPIPQPSAAAETTTAPESKPAWRYARERRLGKQARALVGDAAERELPAALTTVGAEAALAASRCSSWALACLTRAADAEDDTPAQRAWVVLAACRPTVVRRAVSGPPPDRARRRSNRHRHGRGPRRGTEQG